MRPSEQLRFWAHELAAIARTGLEFVTNDYDKDRYERTKTIAEGLASMTIDADFTPERPYMPDVWMASPKTGCTVAAFDDAGRVLLVKRADNGRWALPGGVAEVGSTPAENALRELREETGFEVRIERLVGVYDNKHFGSPSPYHFYTVLFRGPIIGGTATPSVETREVTFFNADALPDEMSRQQRAMAVDAIASTPERAPVYQ